MSISPETVDSAVAGTAVAFTATADLTEGTTYAWEGTNGTFDVSNTASVNFTPTAEGACTVKVTVTNGEKTAVDTVEFTASEAQTLDEQSENTEEADG